MGMTTATIIMHQGVNTGGVFGHIFDFTGMSIVGRMILALVMCILLCTFFTTLAGFFTAKFKMHPFISTMANMLMIFGLVTYATNGRYPLELFEPSIPGDSLFQRLNGLPGTISILSGSSLAIVIVWFILE